MASRKQPETASTDTKPRFKRSSVKAVAPQAAVVDQDTLSVMMAQMQALLAEVQELRQAVQQPSGGPVRPVDCEPVLPDRFAQVLEESIDGCDEDVSAELDGVEAEALLAGVDEALRSVDDGATVDEIVQDVTSSLTQDLEFTEISKDELATLMASAEKEAGELENLEEEFDAAEMEALLAAAAEASGSGGDGDLSADELASALRADLSSMSDVVDLSADATEPEGSAEALGDDEIAAMLSAATGGEVVSELGAAEDDGATLSDDEIAALIAQADSAGTTESADLAQDVPDEDDGSMLTEEELAALVRGEISRQDKELAEITGTVSPVAVDSSTTDNDILTADQIAALMSEPDPDVDPMPESSQAMDEDELAALLAAAQDLAPSSPQPVTQVANPVAEELDDSPAEPSMETPQPTAPVDPGGKPDPGAVKAVPAHMAIRALALPMKFTDGKLLCYVVEPIDQPAVDKISKATGFGVVVVPKPMTDVVRGLREVYSEVKDEHARLTLLTENEVKPTILDSVKSILRRIA